MSVVFEITDRHSRECGSLSVMIDGTSVCFLVECPVIELARQLATWRESVDNVRHPVCFIFRPESDESLLGSFRIEPRPSGWQFTSWMEAKRHEAFLPLKEFTDAARVFIREVETPGP